MSVRPDRYIFMADKNSPEMAGAKILMSVLDLTLPRTCSVCGDRLLSFERHICTECLADIPFTFNWNLPHNPMADRFNERIQNTVYQGAKHQQTKNGHIPYCYATSLFFFNSEARYRKIPYAIKYHGDTPLGYFFGRMLGERIAASPEFSDVDMIIPVPLYWSRKWKRGYNQAEVIARGIARSLPAEVRTDILSRRRHTKTQTRLSVEEKAANVKSAFRSVKKVPPDIRHILLVDDVFTTGATLNACWQALRLAVNGARVSIATLAMVSN